MYFARISHVDLGVILSMYFLGILHLDLGAILNLQLARILHIFFHLERRVRLL